MQGKSAPKSQITVREVPGERGVFELVYPACVRARSDDMEEVHRMLEAGEIDVAVDELRWLLERCRALLEAHELLGRIALAAEDFDLARGHLAYAFELGSAATAAQGLSGVLPSTRPANGPFFRAGRGLAECLKRQGEASAAKRVVERLLALDPRDSLGIRGVLE